MAPSDETTDTNIDINGRNIDLGGAMALTIGDWEDLVEKGVMDDSGQVNTASPRAVIEIVLILAQKIDAEISRDDVRTIPITQLARISKVVEAQLMAEDARPVAAGDPT